MNCALRLVRDPQLHGPDSRERPPAAEQNRNLFSGCSQNTPLNTCGVCLAVPDQRPCSGSLFGNLCRRRWSRGDEVRTSSWEARLHTKRGGVDARPRLRVPRRPPPWRNGGAPPSVAPQWRPTRDRLSLRGAVPHTCHPPPATRRDRHPHRQATCGWPSPPPPPPPPRPPPLLQRQDLRTAFSR